MASDIIRQLDILVDTDPTTGNYVLFDTSGELLPATLQSPLPVITIRKIVELTRDFVGMDGCQYYDAVQFATGLVNAAIKEVQS